MTTQLLSTRLRKRGESKNNCLVPAYASVASPKINENQLAQDIKTNCRQVTAGARSVRPTASALSVRPQKESIAFESKKQEIEVKRTLEGLEKKFSSLFIKLQSNLDELAKNSDHFNSIIWWMKSRTRKSDELSHVKTLDDAFEIIQPYFDFIDCRLIVDLSEEFPIKDKELVTKFKEYKKKLMSYVLQQK
uniref:Uncharacterized protein n=1 Tax=Amphimedon queenslandica TaxID=400682 RepID=A0A1X7SLQ6_AMPQE